MQPWQQQSSWPWQQKWRQAGKHKAASPILYLACGRKSLLWLPMVINTRGGKKLGKGMKEPPVEMVLTPPWWGFELYSCWLAVEGLTLSYSSRKIECIKMGGCAMVVGAESWKITFPSTHRKQRDWARNITRPQTLKALLQWLISSIKASPPEDSIISQTAPPAGKWGFNAYAHGGHFSFPPPQKLHENFLPSK